MYERQWTLCGLNRFPSRTQFGTPPDETGRRKAGLSKRNIVFFVQGTRDEGHLFTDLAGRDVIPQIRLTRIRPSAGGYSFNNLMFPSALLHGRSPSSDASFCRARKRSTFMLLILTPRESAISP